MSKKARDRKRAEDTLNSLPADAIMNSPIMKAMMRQIIRQTYLGGIVMACLIVGLWNIINALKIDAVQSGVVSLSIGVIFLAVQLRTLFNNKVRRGPEVSATFLCPKCKTEILVKGQPEKIVCDNCGSEWPKNP